MTGTAAEKGICTECGAEIRAEAAFCFNCGGAIEASEPTEEAKASSDAWMKGDITEDSEPIDEPKEKDKPIDKPSGQIQLDLDESSAEGNDLSEPVVQKSKNKIETKVKDPKKPKIRMKSAATMRKKPKSLENRKVEVVWEERNSPANVWFIVMSVLISLFAAVMFFLAMYLK